ncbi:MAG: hypothetical protein HN976_11225 [Lentisphaerae bacterium]|nr:hypothetical protein [Lentisphaerota bacterium]MBT4815048.1 hypothetical protein [Lentisphaerota bacterium]MBT7055654.1 hypothetical protein [Lentisphaerota bacterium]
MKSPDRLLVLGDCQSPLGGWVRGGYIMRYIAVRNRLVTGGSCCGSWPGINTSYAAQGTGHPPSSNLLFYDGHVEGLPWPKIRQGGNELVYSK